jgi:hypothetical protein
MNLFWKVFDDRYMFDDGQFYLSLNQTIFSLRFFILHCTFGFNKLAFAIFYENCWTYVVVVIVIW